MDTNVAKIITVRGIEFRSQARRKLGVAKQYHIQFSVGGTLRATKNAKKNNRISWDDVLYFDRDDRTAFLAMVYKNDISSTQTEAVVGSLSDTIGGILTKSKNGVLEVPLSGGTSDPPEYSGITIKLALAVEATEAISALRPTTQIVENVVSAIGTGTQVVTELQTFENTWNVLLKRMDLFNKIVGGIAEIHLYTSLVWSVMLSVNQVLVNQQNHDDRVIRLDPTTGQCIAGPFQGHTDFVNSVAYSPDGSHIVSDSDDDTIRDWDLSTDALASFREMYQQEDGWIKLYNAFAGSLRGLGMPFTLPFIL